jgi:hypothetical protein
MMQCTTELPNSFWSREQYFVDLPYRENYSETPQKASANQCLPLRWTTTSKRLQNSYGENSLSVVEVHGLAQCLCRKILKTKMWQTKDGDQL